MIFIINITHIITGLNLGGAETMLYKLIKNTDRKKYNVEVISLKDKGIIGPKIEQLGIKVHVINMKKIPTINNLFKVRQLIKDAEVVQTWMYHADLIGYLATRFKSNMKVLWGIRRTSLNREENKKSTLLIAKFNALISKKIDKVISCSIAAKKSHINFGYSKDNMMVIPNGFEMNKLNFNSEARYKIRKKLNIENKKVIINIGRWNIAKDHKNLIEAYKQVEDFNTHLIMIGPGITKENIELINLIKKNNIKNYSLLGPQSEITKYLSAADFYVSSSMSEGFPNVIGEAMACQLPCVVTDAGDSSYIVDNTGIIVPIKDSKELSKGIYNMIQLPKKDRLELGVKARNRIEENFDIKVVTEMFEEQYKKIFNLKTK